MAEPTLSLDIQIALDGWRRLPRLNARLQKAAQAVFDHLPKKLRLNSSATVLLTGNAKVRQLNHDFRGQDKPTNVLSFPQFEPQDLPKAAKIAPQVEVGDIAIALQVMAKEAKLESKPVINHTTHLVIHGLLHLFGYDHLTSGEAEAMERLETKIMKSLDLPDPYSLPINE